MAKRKRLHKVRIDEVSSVDKPAQEGAVDVLLKRAFDTDDAAVAFAKGELGMVDPRLTTAADGHQHLIDAADPNGRTSYEHSSDADMGHDHAWVKVGDRIEIAMAEGHTHGLVGGDQVVQARAPEGEVPTGDEPNLAGAAGNSQGDEPMPTQNGNQDPVAKADERIAELEARLEKSERMASLNDAQRTHLSTLPDADRDAFLAKSAEERDAEVKAAADEVAKAAGDPDPIAWTSPRTGEVFRKSAGEAVIGLAKRTDAAEARAERLEKANEDARLEKRAGDELGNLPGEPVLKVAILRALDGVEDKAGVAEFLKAANSRLAQAFEPMGTQEAPMAISKASADEADAELDRLAKAYQSEHPGVGFYDAYDIVSKANPVLLQKALG